MPDKKLLEKIKKLDICPGDKIVIEEGVFKNVSELKELTNFLECKVVVIKDINKIGVLKFNNKSQDDKKKELSNQDEKSLGE